MEPVQPEPITINQVIQRFIASLFSRKLWLAIAGTVFTYVQLSADGLTYQELLTVLSPIFAFIGVEGAADIVERNKQNIHEVTHTEKITTEPDVATPAPADLG